MQTSHHHISEKGVGTNYQLGRDSWPNINQISALVALQVKCYRAGVLRHHLNMFFKSSEDVIKYNASKILTVYIEALIKRKGH